MEIYSFRHVNFTYPHGATQALADVSFTLQQGEFGILCGPSGCGKSTLLRQLKSCLAPHGTLDGEILFEGQPLKDVPPGYQAQKIGFVLQSPENQVVTDKVWHELAFGLESLGYDTPTIRRRVAETAAFFGIETWFHKDVSQLSGGQKQLLSLASVMAMQPSVLVLDEPTAQLDPIAAADFLALLGRINRELGTTILLTEHRLEEAFPYATRILVMDRGSILSDDTPEQVGIRLKESGSEMFLAMPTAMRVWAGLNTQLPCPLTVRDGSQFLTRRAQEQPLLPLPEAPPHCYPEETALSAEDVWFRYEKDGTDVVKGFSLQLRRGEFYALLGGNGAGKTTALKAISGLISPYRGRVCVQGRLSHLPQNPQTLFVGRSVREDLYAVFQGGNLPKAEQDARVSQVVALCGLTALLDRHPYDLSGGEQQRAALAKVLLTQPQVLLLDEPTKGFDAAFKVTFAGILKKLTAQGVTIFMVSHDVAFCAEYAHKCGLYFDGSIAAEGRPREFFDRNSFYTTPANRMARHLVPQAVTVADILAVCGGEPPREKDVEILPAPLPEPRSSAAGSKPQTLPLWRKVIAIVCAAIALGVFVYATSIADLKTLLGSGGLTELGKQQLWLYGILIAALIGLILATGHRSQPIALPKKGKLSRRTVVAAALILLTIPLTILAGALYLERSAYNLVAIAVLLQCMIPFFLVFEGRKPQARELVIIAVLCAIGVAGRGAFFMLPQFKPVMALTIIAGIAFGGETGFLVGAVTMLASNVLFSQGPWTPWQMFSMGITGYLSGILFRKGWLRPTTASMAIFGAFCGFVIYGGIMNFQSAITWNAGNLTVKMLLPYYITGLPMDLVHAAATAIFLALAGRPMLEKLERIKIKYGLVE